MRLARDHGSDGPGITNDPRFHVGWQHFDQEVARVANQLDDFDAALRRVVEGHLDRIKTLRAEVGVHSKIQAVTKAVQGVIDADEKVLLFCHHHATAQELTAALAAALTPRRATGMPAEARWQSAWDAVVPERLDAGVRRAAYQAAEKGPTQFSTWSGPIVVESRANPGGSRIYLTCAVKIRSSRRCCA